MRKMEVEVKACDDGSNSAFKGPLPSGRLWWPSPRIDIVDSVVGRLLRAWRGGGEPANCFFYFRKLKVAPAVPQLGAV